MDVNVLICGPTKSGKSTILGKILEIGQQVTPDEIDVYKKKHQQKNNNGSTTDWYKEYVGKQKSGFAKIFYQANEINFKMLEFKSDEDYVIRLMEKAKSSNIFVLVMSSAFDKELSLIEAYQMRKYIQLFRTLSSSQPSLKLIVLLNKSDADPRNDSRFLSQRITNSLSIYGFNTERVPIVSVSGLNGSNLEYFLDKLGELANSEDSCFSSVLACSTQDPTDVIFEKMWKAVIRIDEELDKNRENNGKAWYERAYALYLAATDLFEQAETSHEASRLLQVAFNAANQAIKDAANDKLLPSLILSHGWEEKGKVGKCMEWYKKAKELDPPDDPVLVRLLAKREIHVTEVLAKTPKKNDHQPNTSTRRTKRS